MADTPATLFDLYLEELQDLRSANDQMQRFVSKVADRASDGQLKHMLGTAEDRIGDHMAALKEMIRDLDADVSGEHCKGMEGLVEEARSHIFEDGADKGPVLDAQIIAQYQRMTHYGLAGFGTAAAFAKALGRDADRRRLEELVRDIYQGDAFATRLAETSVNIKATEDA
jgi:ferritin-like metal-binding protein YciE